MDDDVLMIDLKLEFAADGTADLAVAGGDISLVSGLDNLTQALKMRLLVERGELAGLGHPAFGSRIRDILGARLDDATLQLLRRWVRRTLLSDPRVAEVVTVRAQPSPSQPGAVLVDTEVTAVGGRRLELDMTFHAD